MSGYTIFMALYKNGTNTNSREEVKICTKYLSLERAGSVQDGNAGLDVQVWFWISCKQFVKADGDGCGRPPNFGHTLLCNTLPLFRFLSPLQCSANQYNLLH